MEDREIIELFLQRSDDAIKETKNKYGGYCRTIANNILGDLADTEELENDFYYKLWNTIPPTVPKSLRVYIGTLTRRAAIDKYRCINRIKRRFGKFSAYLDELDECIPDKKSEGAMRRLEDAELRRRINRFLGTLTKTERTLFIRRYYYFDKISDISHDLKMTRITADVKLHRIRAKLKKYLEKEELL